MKNLLKHAFILCTGLVILGARADTLFVSGTVLDTSGALVPGAVVTAHAGGFGGGRGSFGGGGTGYTGGAGLRATDTADANGNYSIVIPNDTFSTVTISATATGFRTSGRGQIDTIAAPKDGKSDYATVNVILTEGTYTVAATGDSLIVSGTVTDSAGNPVDSATVTVRTGTDRRGWIRGRIRRTRSSNRDQRQIHGQSSRGLHRPCYGNGVNTRRQDRQHTRRCRAPQRRRFGPNYGQCPARDHRRRNAGGFGVYFGDRG